MHQIILIINTPYSHAAARLKSFDVLDVLLKSGVCINSLNSSKNTMLDAAFAHGHIKTAIWLVKHGACLSVYQQELSQISPSSCNHDNAIYFVFCIFKSMLKQGFLARIVSNFSKCKRTQFLQEMDDVFGDDLDNVLAPYQVSKQTNSKKGLLFKYIEYHS